MTGLSPHHALHSAASMTTPTPRDETPHSVPPPNAAPGKVLFVSGPQESPQSQSLKLAGHDILECHSLRGLCLQLKYQQPDVIVMQEGAVGPLDQAIRIVRGRHTTVPLILLSEAANPGLTPIRHGFYAAVAPPASGEDLMIVTAHAVAHHRMLKRINHLEVEASGRGFAGISGNSAFARRLYRKVQAFAASDVHALLVGENGTGKALVARAIHDHSARARGPFIALSCERLSDAAFSADAFVNASMGSPGMRQQGALDDADRGTLYLANIEALSPRLQEQLLGALSERSSCDFRLVASTTVNLNERIAQGQFRPELLAHLTHSQLHMLPLRSRPVDIGPIGQTVLDALTREQGKPRMVLSRDAVSTLEQHRFQRNITELREILATTLSTCSGISVEAPDLPALVQVPSIVGVQAHTAVTRMPDSTSRRRQVLFEILAQKPMKIRDLERCAIEATLQRTNENVTQAMRELGIGRTTLYRKLKKYGRR